MTTMLPHQTMWNNLDEVERLLKIHTLLVGDKPGYKHKVEVLNKSAIVLLVACWEAFVEDIAETGFDFLLSRAKSPSDISPKVLGQAGRHIKDSLDESTVWQLAEGGWKHVLQTYRRVILERYIGRLNTPKPDQVDEIYRCLFGIQNLSRGWHWTGMKSENAVKKLQRLVTLRGAISHRVATSEKVHKDMVRDYIGFINHIAICTSNTVREAIVRKTVAEPWPTWIS